MYQGKHSTSGSPRADRPAAPRRAGGSKKPLTLFVALVLLLTLAVGGSLAWLVSDDDVTNSMVPGTGDITITEEKEGNVKTSVKITNTGNIDVYVRVAVVVNNLDENGNVIAGASTNRINANGNWQYLDDDGYYYYIGTVAPGEKNAVELLDGRLDFNGKEVDILAQSIQALGIIDDKPASVAAWGRSFDGNSWS